VAIALLYNQPGGDGRHLAGKEVKKKENYRAAVLAGGRKHVV
jgi:hypothetical protein